MSEKRVDTIGRAQYVRKSTQPEIARRTTLIIKHWQRGHSVTEIAEGLRISPEVVRSSLRGVAPDRSKRVRGRGRIIEACLWRDEDVPADERDPYAVGPEPRWRRSQIIGMAQMLNDEYTETNFANILANQATDAEAAGDLRWVTEALKTIGAAIEKLERARRVLTDDHYRAACRDTLEGVEQMRRAVPLRAVR